MIITFFAILWQLLFLIFRRCFSRFHRTTTATATAVVDHVTRHQHFVLAGDVARAEERMQSPDGGQRLAQNDQAGRVETESVHHHLLHRPDAVVVRIVVY